MSREKIRATHNEDGSVLLEWEDRSVTIPTDTIERLNAHGVKTQYFILGDNGYLYASGARALHQHVLTDEEKSQHEAWLRERGWVREETDIMTVMHLNDDRLDLRAENLFWGPRSLNMQCRKTKPKTTRNGKWTGLYGRKTVICVLESYEEACHAMDCAKMATIKDTWRREIVFKHGLVRPVGYEEHSINPEKMEKRYQLYKPPEHAKPVIAKKPKFKTIAMPENSVHVLNNLIEAKNKIDASPEGLEHLELDLINALIESGEIFKPEMDVFYVYNGQRGRVIQGCVEVKDYDAYLKDYIGTVHLTLGYPMLEGKPIHMLCAGRIAGDASKDKMVVQHKGQQKLDARKRFLCVGSYSQRARHVEKKRAGAFQGVTEESNGTFTSRISFNWANYHLGTYNTQSEAVHVYQAMKRKADDVAQLVKLEACPKKRRELVKQIVWRCLDEPDKT